MTGPRLGIMIAQYSTSPVKSTKNYEYLERKEKANSFANNSQMGWFRIGFNDLFVVASLLKVKTLLHN